MYPHFMIYFLFFQRYLLLLQHKRYNSLVPLLPVTRPPHDLIAHAILKAHSALRSIPRSFLSSSSSSSSASAQQMIANSALRPASANATTFPANPAPAHALSYAMNSVSSHASVRTLSASLAFEAAEVLGALGQQSAAREVLGKERNN